jgi:uncharacterized delta-60 repeat protein
MKKHVRGAGAARQVRISLTIIIVCSFLISLMPKPVEAADGDLDTGFGASSGFTRTDFNSSAGDQANAVAIQPSDNKIVAGGKTTVAMANDDFALARYNPNGALDTVGFGSGTGKVTTEFNGGNDNITALAIQPSDGKIVAVGFACTDSMCGSTDYALARYNTDGTLDTTFGPAMTGKITTDFAGGQDFALAVAIQPSDDKIVVAGLTISGSAFFSLARYNTDGTLDTTFGPAMTGKVVSAVPGGANAVAIQSDGKIVAGGSESDFTVARFNGDGTLDTAGFGSPNGFVTTDFAMNTDTLSALAIQPSDDKIVAVGNTNTGSDFALVRYNTDGTLDTTGFGGGTGKVTTDFGGLSDEAHAVLIQPDDKIVAIGNAVDPTPHPCSGTPVVGIGLARYNTDGTLDTTFGSAMTGKVIEKLGNTARGNGAALQSDNGILVAGLINTPCVPDNDFFVARFQNTLNSSCVLDCPTDITVSNDPGQCKAVVSFVVGSTDACGEVMCSPASGSMFPVGVTTVTCTPDMGSSCSFNVTVNDTENPSFASCPANIQAVSSQGCSSAPTAMVNYSTPQASDNCPGAMVACVPPSGSAFPTGTTTVTCTATDASSNTATCSFSVTVFGVCLKDDSNPGNTVLFNPNTGDYIFCCNGVLIASGVGTVSKVGCSLTIQHNTGDRRVLIKADTAFQKGTASIQKPAGTLRCSITDKNLSSAPCMCQ